MDILLSPGADIHDVEEEPPIMDTILTWVGFDQVATRDRIREEGFGSFDDLMPMKEKEPISEQAKVRMLLKKD